MNIASILSEASAKLHQSIDAAGESAKEAVRQHAAKELDRIKVNVGWMIRSDGQKRRWRGQGK